MTVDDIRTGTWVTVVGGQPSRMQIRRCRMSVVAGPDAGKEVQLESDWIRVGARQDSDLVLTDPRVSGSHFEIRLTETGYLLRDLDSTNGTWLGGFRVREVYLKPGAAIYVGDTRLRFDPQPDSVSVELSSRDRFGEMVGRSVGMRALFARLERIAPSDVNVLVTGETGTGKELVAGALHEYSNRASGPFVVVDCGSLPENLIESELFGHEKGAFTGATMTYAGAFERASGGTVFLDEIGELPVQLQPKLLGALERRAIRRVGGNEMIPVDIRVVAATNRDLAKEMNRGNFREDLYYRIAVVKMYVPPLRERKDDIPLLIEHFLATMPGGTGIKLRPETIEHLCNHDYPGNIRELRNLIERSAILAEHVDSGAVDLFTGSAPRPAPAPTSSAPAAEGGSEGGGAVDTLEVPIDVGVPFKRAKQWMVEEFERRYLTELLEQCDGNVSQAARTAGLDRMTVHKMLNRRGIGRR